MGTLSNFFIRLTIRPMKRGPNESVVDNRLHSNFLGVFIEHKGKTRKMKDFVKLTAWSPAS
ncbi:hypothetical protein H5410_010851 [Solanum commersonii]|uniref:Uncharacterized protein n=1 Tax=Solanum commersonii TaxID=4109 RepID=A0A9J6AMM2_SOLCO|nr:hypothetical protein H5410_010851 [Solanum commersonii]